MEADKKRETLHLPGDKPPAPVVAGAIAAAAEAEAAPVKAPEKRYTMILNDSEEIPGNDDSKRIFVGSNGRALYLPTGRKVNVPAWAKAVLDDAKFSVCEVDPNTRKLTGRKRDKLRFSYQIVDPD